MNKKINKILFGISLFCLLGCIVMLIFTEFEAALVYFLLSIITSFFCRRYIFEMFNIKYICYCKQCNMKYFNAEKYCSNCGDKLYKKLSINLNIKKSDIIIIFINILLILFTLGIGNIIFYYLYEYFYFKSKYFLNLKNSIQKYIDDSNDLNTHIEELKKSYINIKKIDYGNSNFTDVSINNYKRPELNKYLMDSNVYNCSAAICKNSQQQPFKYLCKYFNIIENEESLQNFEKILNDFSAAEQGKILLNNIHNDLIKNISSDIPLLIRIFGKKKIKEKLGFKKIDFSQLYFPRYVFQYTSPGGYSSLKNEIILDIDNLNKFIEYLSKIIKFKKSVNGQRALMTSSLREKIKMRDNYTCQICGNSTQKEPNLLLEIDHIIPLSKKGQTTESNLQTLCWKCNRSKGSKIY